MNDRVKSSVNHLHRILCIFIFTCDNYCLTMWIKTEFFTAETGKFFGESTLSGFSNNKMFSLQPCFFYLMKKFIVKKKKPRTDKILSSFLFSISSFYLPEVKVKIMVSCDTNTIDNKTFHTSFSLHLPPLVIIITSFDEIRNSIDGYRTE